MTNNLPKNVPPGKPRNVKPSPKMKKLIEILQDTMDNPGFTWGQALLDAGYSESVSKAPSNIRRSKTFQEMAPHLVENSSDIATLAGAELKRRMSPDNVAKEKTSDINNVLYNTIKLGRLLNDEATSISKNTKEDMRELTDDELREMSGEIIDVEANE